MFMRARVCWGVLFYLDNLLPYILLYSSLRLSKFRCLSHLIQAILSFVTYSELITGLHNRRVPQARTKDCLQSSSKILHVER